MDQRLEEAIMRTVLYGDVFDCALTVEEIHHYLIHDEPATLAQIHETLVASQFLQTALCCADGYIARADRPELIGKRRERQTMSREVWETAITCGNWLARLPFVKMVALTGALAVQNPSRHDDDFDYMLVTQVGRVWLARAFAVVLVRLGKLRGVVICPNYVLDENSLAQNRHDLFMAHEVAQMVPLFGQNVYTAMRKTNNWTNQFLPNASDMFYPHDETPMRGGWLALKRGLEFLLGGRMGNVLERWEYRRKLRRFATDMKTPHSAAKLDSAQVKGHFNDHGHPVLNRYQERLQQYGIGELQVAGD